MKKILPLLLISLLFVGCTETNLTKLKKPIIVIGCVKDTPDRLGTIILKDADGIFYTYTSNRAIGNTLIYSHKTGDTIK